MSGHNSRGLVGLPRQGIRVSRCRVIAGMSVALMMGVVAHPVAAQDRLWWSSRARALLGDSERCAASAEMEAAMSWSRATAALSVGTSSTPAPSSAYGVPLIAAHVELPVHEAWTLRATGAAGRPAAPCAEPARWSRGWIQLATHSKGTELALSLGSTSLSSADPTRDRQGVTAGVARSWGRAEWGVELRHYSRRSWGDASAAVPAATPGLDTLRSGTIPSEGNAGRASSAHARSRQLQFVDTRAQWRWTHRRLAFELIAGGTVGTFGSDSSSGVQPDTGEGAGALAGARLRTQLWGRADVRMRLAPSVVLAFGVAALPAQPDVGLGIRRYLSMGIELSLWRRPAPSGRESKDAEESAHAFEVVRGASAHDSRATVDTLEYLVRLRAASARTVELAGEQNGWTVTPLHASGRGWWEGALRMRPGSYRMSIRIDGGGWQAPPGYVPIRDEFGGQSALVVVP